MRREGSFTINALGTTFDAAISDVICAAEGTASEPIASQVARGLACSLSIRYSVAATTLVTEVTTTIAASVAVDDQRDRTVCCKVRWATAVAPEA